MSASRREILTNIKSEVVKLNEEALSSGVTRHDLIIMYESVVSRLESEQEPIYLFSISDKFSHMDDNEKTIELSRMTEYFSRFGFELIFDNNNDAVYKVKKRPSLLD